VFATFIDRRSISSTSYYRQSEVALPFVEHGSLFRSQRSQLNAAFDATQQLAKHAEMQWSPDGSR
jgi:hypothetical protein